MDLEGAKVLLPFEQTGEARYPILIANDEVRAGESPFGAIRELPTTFVLDRDGKVAAAYTGPADPRKLEALVQKLLR